MLRGEEIKEYFDCDENEFYVFFNANRRLDRLLGNYFKNFKALIPVDVNEAVIEQELDNWGDNYKSSKVLGTLAKRLRKAAIVKLSPQEELKYIGIVAQIYSDLNLIKTNTRLFRELYRPRREDQFQAPRGFPGTAHADARALRRRVHGL